MTAVIPMMMYWYKSWLVPKMAVLMLERLKVAIMPDNDSEKLLDGSKGGGSGIKMMVWSLKGCYQ